MKRRSNTLTEKEIDLLGNQKKVYVTDFDEGLKRFLKNCKIKGLRSDTIEYYERELTAFQRILTDQNVTTNPSEITGGVIETALIEYMLDNGAQATSVNTRLRAVFAFFNYLHKKRFIRYNPVAGVELLKHRKKVMPTYSEKELKSLLKVPNLKTFTGLRDYTMMLLFLDTGIRVSELARLDVADVLLGDNQMVVNSKNDYERMVPLSKKMVTALKKYLTIRGDMESTALFVTLDGLPLKTGTVKNRLWQIGDKLGSSVLLINFDTHLPSFTSSMGAMRSRYKPFWDTVQWKWCESM